MFGIFKKIFSPGGLSDSIVSGVDKAFLSKEESVDYHQTFLKLYEPYKLAQRLLALMFTGVYLFIHLITAIAHFVYVIKDKSANSVIELYAFNHENLGTIALVIVGFYFAGGAVEGVVKRVQKRTEKNQYKK